MLKKFINYLFIFRKRKMIKRMVTLTGNNYDKRFVVRSTTVSLCDGSSSSDIEIGERVWLWGSLNSQSGGKIILGDYFKMGENSVINAVDSVRIGKYTAIAEKVHISDNNNHPVNPSYRKYMRIKGDVESRLWKHSAHAPVVIGENCWIGRNVSIMKGVTIGDNCVIAANSVVTKSIPANCIAAGNPAKVVKTDIQDIPAPTSCVGYNEYIKQQIKNGPTK